MVGRRGLTVLVTLLIVADATAEPAVATPLDTTFGAGGVVLTDLGPGDGVTGWQGVMAPDAPASSITTVGTALEAGHRELVLARFGAQGQPDVGFPTVRAHFGD